MSSNIIMTKENNPNIERKLVDSLLNLLKEKEFKQISVTQICQKTKINRTTFYLYFDSKDDLLIHSFQQFLTPLIATFDKSISFTEKISNLESINGALSAIQPYLRIFSEIINLKTDKFDATQKLYDYVYKNLTSKFKIEMPTVLVDYYAGEFATSLIYTLKWWVSHPNISSKQIAKIIYNACYNGLNNLYV